MALNSGNWQLGMQTLLFRYNGRFWYQH